MTLVEHTKSFEGTITQIDTQALGTAPTALASIKVRAESPLAVSMICSCAVGKVVPITTVPAAESILALSRASLQKFHPDSHCLALVHIICKWLD